VLLQRNNKLIVMDSIVIAVNEPMFAPGPLEHIFGGNNKLTTADWCEVLRVCRDWIGFPSQ